MRNISFQLTTAQIRARSKTVTRRLGWKNLKRGDLLRGCVKCMGLKPGEKIEPLAVVRVVDVRREPLNTITGDDCVKEGFPAMSPADFVAMFCEHMDCEPHVQVTRIEFAYET